GDELEHARELDVAADHGAHDHVFQVRRERRQDRDAWQLVLLVPGDQELAERGLVGWGCGRRRGGCRRLGGCGDGPEQRNERKPERERQLSSTERHSHFSTLARRMLRLVPRMSGKRGGGGGSSAPAAPCMVLCTRASNSAFPLARPTLKPATERSRPTLTLTEAESLLSSSQGSSGGVKRALNHAVSLPLYCETARAFSGSVSVPSFTPSGCPSPSTVGAASGVASSST